jgi:hypothetical protein
MNMQLTLFRDIFGLTAEPTGSNLPAEFSPWQKARQGAAAEAYAGSSLEGLALFDPAIRAVDRYGFYLGRSGMTVMGS